MDQESKIHTKCKIENCQWGAHPKTGLCSHHDPWLSRRVKWRQIQREEQEVKITEEIITRQRGIFGDKSNISLIIFSFPFTNLLLESISTFCGEILFWSLLKMKRQMKILSKPMPSLLSLF